MKVFNYITLRFSAILLLVVVGLISVSSCQRELEFTEEPGEPYVPVEVLFRATVGSTLGVQAVDGRLAPPNATDGAKFEEGDAVGLFLHNLGTSAAPALDAYYSHSNHKYTADVSVKFVATPVPHYETYHKHNIYAYYPHSEEVNLDAAAIVTGVSADQSDGEGVGYEASDFLAAHIADVVPKQKDPSQVLAMEFKHMMTSVVVNVSMADGSELIDLTGVRIGNTFIGTTIDITKAPAAAVQTAATTTSHTLNTEAGVKDVAMWRYNAESALVHNFRAIVVPQAVVAGKTLIKVVFGSGGSARVFPYIPKVGDAVHTSGLVQGAEHVFNLSFTGVDLMVSGGDIVPWGSGIIKEGEIAPGGETAMKMIFDIVGDASAVSSAELTINGAVYKTVRVEHIGGATPQLVCYYYMGGKWGSKLNSVSFLNASGVPVSTSIAPSGDIRILGDPTSPAYSEVIAKITF